MTLCCEQLSTWKYIFIRFLLKIILIFGSLLKQWVNIDIVVKKNMVATIHHNGTESLVFYAYYTPNIVNVNMLSQT